MKTIVIIPAFNEQAAIGEIVEKSLQYADDVLVVDDGSTFLIISFHNPLF